MSEDDKDNVIVDDQVDDKVDDQQDPPNDPPDDKQDPPVVDTDDNKDDIDDSTDDDDPVLDSAKWGTTGTSDGDNALLILQESGVEPAKAKELLWDAVQSNDFTKIDKDALAEAMGSKAQASLVITGIKAYSREIADRTAEVTKTVTEEVGSKEAWDTLTEWAKENLEENELNEYIALVGEGGRKARMAARDLKERYEEEGNTSLTDNTVTPKTNRKPANKVEALSRAEYFDKLDSLQRQGKLTPQIEKQLFAAREAGKKQGK